MDTIPDSTTTPLPRSSVVTVQRDHARGQASYRLGQVVLRAEAGRLVQAAIGKHMLKLRDLRDLRDLLALPEVLALQGCHPPGPVCAEPIRCDDPLDPALHGRQIGTTYRCGAVELTVDCDPAAPPYLAAFGADFVRLDTFARDLPAVLALLANPQVRRALRPKVKGKRPSFAGRTTPR